MVCRPHILFKLCFLPTVVHIVKCNLVLSQGYVASYDKIFIICIIAYIIKYEIHTGNW